MYSFIFFLFTSPLIILGLFYIVFKKIPVENSQIYGENKTNSTIQVETLKPKVRDSGIEILRIFMMLWVIGSHVTGRNLEIFEGTAVDRILGTKIGLIADNVFVIISAYFMITKKITAKKIISLVVETFFYSSIIYIIAVILGIDTWSIKGITTHIFPTYNMVYWFISCYVMLMLASPMLNKFINSLSIKKLGIICVCLLFYDTIISSYKYYIVGFLSTPPFYSQIVHFVVLYFCGAYIRLSNLKISNWILIPIAMFVIINEIVIIPIIENVQNDIFSFYNVFIAFMLFLIFNNFHFKNKFINAVSTTVFGVYLIHEHNSICNYIHKAIMGVLIKFTNNSWVVYLITILFIFVVASLIDFVRQKTLHKLFLKFYEKCEKLVKKGKTEEIIKTTS